ncbi:MAG: class I SAM-dependent methyltransferase [Nonlabens sp.]
MTTMESIATAHRPVTPHSILVSKLEQLQEELLSRGSHMDVLDLVDECKSLVSTMDQYLLECSSTPSTTLQQLEASSNAMDWDSAFAKADTALPLEREMLSGALEGQFLKFLVAATQSKSILEIGSFTSYASLAMAESLPADGLLIACEYDAFTADFARRQLDQSKHGDKVQIIKGDALDSMQSLASKDLKFDFVFIDANKDGYINYYQSLFDLNLLAPQAVIVVDNTLYMGQAYNAGPVNSNGRAIQDFNKMIAGDNRVQKVMIPLRDGVTLIRHCE